MVSTRQMATSSGNGKFNHNAAPAASIDSARPSTMATQTQRSMVAASSVSTILATGVSMTAVRHCGQHQYQQNSNVRMSAHELVKMDDTAVLATNANTIPVQLLDMPIEVLAKIFAYVGYRKVGQLRVVSHKMNGVCMDILNSTFSRLITQTYNRFHAIKANMPRRESARRNHPLSCECDIIETCYMRLSLLQMTFGKHIERGHCCFFPGAILDEVYNILTYIRNTPRLERPYRVTDELFDLSTMAMEYFRDRIEQTLPDIAYFNKDFFKLPTTTKRPALVTSADHADSSSTSPPQSNMVLRKGIRKIKQGMKIYNNQLSVLRNELRTCKRKSSEQGKQIAEQQKLIAEQQKQTLEYANRLDENDQKNEEMARKFSTLLQELNKCKTELQYWRSKSPAIPICTSCGQKLAPIMPPPQDFQALVNQGVKPEDIILNLGDDTDVESDMSITESNDTTEMAATTATAIFTQSPQSSVFAFPDKETTAKLLAVSSTLTKNQLKRPHFSTSSSIGISNVDNVVGSVFGSYAGNGNGNRNSSNNCCNCQYSSDNQLAVHSNANTSCDILATDADAYGLDPAAQQQPPEMTNRLNYMRNSNIIRTPAVGAVGNGHSNSWYDHQSYGKHHNNPATSAAKDVGNIISCELVGQTNGSSTSHTENASNGTFEHLGGRSQKSVIVSAAAPMSIKDSSNNSSSSSNQPKGTGIVFNCNACAVDMTTTVATGAAAVATPDVEFGCYQAKEMNDASDPASLSGAGSCCAQAADEAAVEHVVSLQSITSHEIKKARRVQKATRCLNGSGKRSK